MNNYKKHTAAVLGLVMAGSPLALAQEAPSLEAISVVGEEPIEEVTVTGRYLSASQQVLNERIADGSVTDLLDAETMKRLGDSTVGGALSRVPGITLVADKFVYIRGLGERYSASYLNGAQIPSPDLTRNVIPLDIFPTSVVQSLRVQKAWSADLPANFGGGAVNIRTKGVPDALVMTFEIGGGYNSLSSGENGFSYQGGDDDWRGVDDGSRALSPVIQQALTEYQGDVSTQNIYSTLLRQDPNATFEQAQAINRSLGLELNRDIGVQTKSLPYDLALRASVGNNFEIGTDWELGFGIGASYRSDWRQTTAKARNFNFPDTRTDIEQETTYSVNTAGTLNLGAKFLRDHEISTTSLLLRVTDDETAVTDFFNENREIPDGLGFRGYRLQFEERNMLTNQVRGTHYFGADTRERFSWLGSLLKPFPEETRIDWFYSDSDATTDIPNQVTVSSQTVTDPITTAVQAEQVLLSNTAGDWRFTELDDEVLNYGWSFNLPIEADNSAIELIGGWSHVSKARTYQQAQFSLGANAVGDNAVLQGPLDDVFSDPNVTSQSNNYLFDRQGTNNESYIAATMTDAVFAAVDWTWSETWRTVVGARWEDYRQAAVDWNPYGYTPDNPQITTDPDVLAAGTYQSDDIFPSASITYMSDWWAETFQLRLGYSETAVRPDLREITAASYIDPITGDLTRGNPGVEPADVHNFDLRGEWFFGGGDNLSVTLFRKQIDKPIEFFESAASDTTVAREIVNATSAEVQGIELEGLKSLAFLGGFFDTLFIQGNITVQDSELVCSIDAANSCAADAPTNPVRPLSGASDYIANVVLGFDSPEGKHSASVIYNVSGERLYVAGRNGAPDGYEQPFHSLDFTYFWYPTERMTLKLRARNLLGEEMEIQRNGIVTFVEDPGQSVSLMFSWAL